MDIFTSICVGLFLLCVELGWRVEAAGDQGGHREVPIESECRDRYLWLHVAATGVAPQFEAVDNQVVHSISGQNGQSCGYTISQFRMDGYTTFRASYYSCYTSNQNDEVFTFTLNIILTDAEGHWWSQLLSKTCDLPLVLAQREVLCEEHYMEVSVDQDMPCEDYHGGSKEIQKDVLSLAQKTATSVWQLMFLLAGNNLAIMSASEARGLGYSLMATPKRLVFRSPYKQPHSQLVHVHGVPVEVIKLVLFFRRKLVVVMTDFSLSCTVGSGSFDGSKLLLETPQVMPPMVWAGERFESRSIVLGVEGRLVDWNTTIARGWTVTQDGPVIQVGIPFGSEGGYRRSMVVNNVYRETYIIFLFYEHVFSMLYDDGSEVETRQRLVRVLDTPLLCRHPFTLDQTMPAERVFDVYMGNIPFDVTLVEVKINDRHLPIAVTPEYSINRIVNANGSQAYTLHVPFDSRVVHRMHLDHGLVQYSMSLNYTLIILPQRLSYYHYSFVSTQLDDAFAPEPTAECTPTGITFSLWKSPQMEFLWEIGVGAEPLTPELAELRGYRLYNDTQSITLEVPVFSIGYTYQDINLHDFYGVFQLLVRDAKTLALQSMLSGRCVFETRDLIVCSPDGIMTVVTTPSVTLPRVHPDSTTLLDRSCRPKQTDPSRALFEFSLNSCGTRTMVGDTFLAYENEILYHRRLLADETALISRDSKFKLTVRCFYPLSTISRLPVERIFPMYTPGLGLILGTKGSTLPPGCPYENSPFHGHRSIIHDPWPGQQSTSPRASSPAGRDDLPWLTDNLLPVSFNANSPVNDVETVDLFNQKNVGYLDPNRPAGQKREMSGNVGPHNHTHNLPRAINALSSQKQEHMSNSNYTDQPMGKSALYFQEFFKVKVAAREKESTTAVTTKPPATNTTSAVSTQNSPMTSASVTQLV
uniref:ZP domain-containing protein n=1 Tax=Gadus morhua TaxID=8049 RepID=A0A8C4Z967_GADMO